MKIIAGPCQHESLEHSTMIAKHCKSVCDDLGIDYYFKASFDKANRTSANGKRGRGMQRTMDDFVQIKENLDVKILTDFHSVFEIHAWRGVDEWYNAIDVIQIPAFLCRQTDLITTACNSGKIVNIKKGQFLAPWDVEGILSKTKSANEVWITERGTSFGYNTLVVDFTGILYMLEHYNNPIVFDVTHSVQKPGGKGSSSGGNRNFVAPLSRGAAAMGVDNFFLEVHDDPDNAPSDGPNMIRLDNFETVIKDIKDSYRE
jgi:2-dehydro-3-deoxyphosphooctonate aldolase (KDO 8-P synthase)